jgi:hypothetical protein
VESGWKVGQQQWLRDRRFVISPQQSSLPIATECLTISLARRSSLADDLADYLYEQSGEEGWVAPWLIGRIFYSDTFGQSYSTSFCIRAYRDGDYTEYGEPPYNERT